MTMSLSTEVRMIKGVGPQRAELLAQRGIFTLEDLFGYLPFRYEDRIRFSKVKEIQPNGTYTIRARVMSGQAVRTMRGRDAIYHLLVQDDTGQLPCRSEEHTSELQSRRDLVCRLLLEKKKKQKIKNFFLNKKKTKKKNIKK